MRIDEVNTNRTFHDRYPLHCILPPYILNHMAKSQNPRTRDRALKNIAAAATARTLRLFAPPLTMRAFSLATGTKNVLVYDLKGKDPSPFNLPGALARSQGAGPVADPAVDEAYDFAGYTYDFYQAIFNRNSLDDAGMSLISSVHAGDHYNNAFWNGSQMAYGDGDGEAFDRFTKALDVVGHELTHGVESHTSNLQYQGESGALNEHFADVFGTLVKQWKDGTPASGASWLIGEEILIPATTRSAIRSMRAPGTAFQNDPDLGTDPQPDHISNKYTGPEDEGGVHINSGIPNKVFFLVATSFGGNAWQDAGTLWYRLMLALSPTDDFAAAAQTCRNLAVTLFGQGSKATAVDHAWSAVGL